MLTAKQARFVDEYLIDLNATDAAVRSGYSPKTAHATGWENLRKPEIAAAINAKREIVQARNELTQDWVINKLVENVERAMSAVPVRDNRGEPTGEYTYQGSVANKGLELLGKYLGIAGFATTVTNDNRTLNLNGLNVDELKALASYVRSR